MCCWLLCSAARYPNFLTVLPVKVCRLKLLSFNFFFMEKIFVPMVKTVIGFQHVSVMIKRLGLSLYVVIAG